MWRRQHPAQRLVEPALGFSLVVLALGFIGHFYARDWADPHSDFYPQQILLC
jgi:hypothetical protein